MSTIWTREELLGLIACWKAAYKAASTGKSYTVQGRTLTRYDLPEIRQQLVYLQGELAALDTGRRGPAIVDLAANDWAAHSAVEAISGNAIGTGLVPKSSIPADMLGIPPESARELGKRMEWAFALWTSEADVRGQCHFADLQNLGIRTMLSLGEMLHLAVMLNEKERERQNRAFSFALQTLSPARLMTPDDQQSAPLHGHEG